eukprot:70798-Pelagomonas_calceolata.AAC.2
MIARTGRIGWSFLFHPTALGSRLPVCVYHADITPPKTQGLAPHHDDVEIFICQTQGGGQLCFVAALSAVLHIRVLTNSHEEHAASKGVGNARGKGSNSACACIDALPFIITSLCGAKRWKLYKPLSGFHLPNQSSPNLPVEGLGEPVLDTTLRQLMQAELCLFLDKMQCCATLPGV